MTQIFNVTIDGILSVVEKCNISEEMNRFYDVAFFEIKEEPQAEDSVIINFGDRTFTGFVYSTSKISKLLYRVECRTQGAKLTEPYSTYTEGFDKALTSHDLCALYESKSGVPINITAGNIDFGGSYERTGTMLSALSNIANVTGAEYWDDGSSIQIQPNKHISDNGVEIPPDKIFDFVQLDKTIYNKGVGFITIRNGGSETSDIISKNNIYVEIDECSGEIFVYPNPYGTIEHTSGLSPLSVINVDRDETQSLLDRDVVVLNGAIKSIESVTINGANVSDYNFEQGHNVIYFNTLKRGTLKVTYKAYAYNGYTNITNTLIGRFITFDIFYLDQVVMFQGFLLCVGDGDADDNDSNISTDGDMVCIVPDNMRYPKGFDVYTIGGDPEILFYNRSVEIVRGVASISSDYTSIETARLEDNDGTFKYRTRYSINSALEARSAGVSVPYTISNDGDDYYFNFTQYYPKLKVSYITVATKHTIQFTNIIDGDISMIIKNKNTGEICEYSLDGLDEDDLNGIPCELNQYVPVNVASELGIEVSDARGSTLSYTDPLNITHNVTVDNFGIARIWVFIDGKYIIDSSSLKARTTVTLTSNVNG